MMTRRRPTGNMIKLPIKLMAAIALWLVVAVTSLGLQTGTAHAASGGPTVPEATMQAADR